MRSSSKRRGGVGRRRHLAVDQAEVAEEVLRHLDREVGRGLLEMLAALDHQGRARRIGAGMRAVLDQRRARAEAGRHHQVHARPRQRAGDRGIARERRVDPERHDVLAGRMDVEDVLGLGHRRPHLAGAAQLDAVFRAVEPGARPDAVEVVRDQPALERLRRIEGLVGGDVGEAQRQRADLRPHAAVEQMADGDHAAELVAVGQGVDHHVRAGLAGLEAVHVVDAGVAGAVGGEVARRDLDGGKRCVHARDCAGRCRAQRRWPTSRSLRPLRSRPRTSQSGRFAKSTAMPVLPSAGLRSRSNTEVVGM